MKLFKKFKKNSQTKTPKKEWEEFAPEGELTIDAFETSNEIVIISAIGGISAKDLSISFEDGMLIIEGERKRPEITNGKPKKYLYEECFWGKFSRKIILPEEVNVDKAKATVKNGILILRVPKKKQKVQKEIQIEEE